MEENENKQGSVELSLNGDTSETRVKGVKKNVR